jgi:hypothetical protein
LSGENRLISSLEHIDFFGLIEIYAALYSPYSQRADCSNRWLRDRALRTSAPENFPIIAKARGILSPARRNFSLQPAYLHELSSSANR